jgi:hypothetical protein
VRIGADMVLEWLLSLRMEKECTKGMHGSARVCILTGASVGLGHRSALAG